eukprot:15088662-Heterocapsa_arctica.AAC.1
MAKDAWQQEVHLKKVLENEQSKIDKARRALESNQKKRLIALGMEEKVAKKKRELHESQFVHFDPLQEPNRSCTVVPLIHLL